MSNMVAEYCNNCESEITMEWDIARLGYKAYCPVCGERLMLCDECLHRRDGEFTDDCDYDGQTDSCRFNNDGYYVFRIMQNGSVTLVKLEQREPTAELLKYMVGGTFYGLPVKYGVLVVNGDNLCGDLYIPPRNATTTAMLQSGADRYVGGDAVLVQSDEHNRLIGFTRKDALTFQERLFEK